MSMPAASNSAALIACGCTFLLVVVVVVVVVGNKMHNKEFLNLNMNSAKTILLAMCR